MRKASRVWLVLGFVLLIGAVARFTALDWDETLGAHPDERYIVGVAERARWPDRMDPFEADPSYAYGHLPLMALAGALRLAPQVDSLLIARGLAAGVSVLTIAAAYLAASDAAGSAAGLVASALVALAPLHVQQAHFYTTDVFLTLFALSCVLFSVRLVRSGRAIDSILSGAAAGLAVASKASGAWLAVPIAAACAMGPGTARDRACRGLVCTAAALSAFGAVSPFALIRLPQFLQNVAFQAAVARGALAVPYTRQFIGTTPYVYHAAQLLQWGVGWLPGVAMMAALVAAGANAMRGRASTPSLVLLAFVLPYGAFFGGLFVKYPRYLLPLTPCLAILASMTLAGRRESPGDATGSCPSHNRPRAQHQPSPWLVAATSLVLLAAALRCLTFVQMYRQLHPWVEVSSWFAHNAGSGSRVAVEEWDHPLPAGVPGIEHLTLPVYDSDSDEKWEGIAETLQRADYVVIASRRAYASVGRQPGLLPTTAAYYVRLFSGRIGFSPVACFGRFPSLGPISLADDPTAGLAFKLPDVCTDYVERQSEGLIASAALRVVLGRIDESLVVYDHPTAIIFKRSGPVPDGDALRMMLSE